MKLPNFKRLKDPELIAYVKQLWGSKLTTMVMAAMAKKAIAELQLRGIPLSVLIENTSIEEACLVTHHWNLAEATNPRGIAKLTAEIELRLKQLRPSTDEFENDISFTWSRRTNETADKVWQKDTENFVRSAANRHRVAIWDIVVTASEVLVRLEE
jgi:hypothetical protein